MEFVLEDALVQVAGDADVNGSRGAAHDVDTIGAGLAGYHVEVGMLRLHIPPASREECCAQHDRGGGGRDVMVVTLRLRICRIGNVRITCTPSTSTHP